MTIPTYEEVNEDDYENFEQVHEKVGPDDHGYSTFAVYRRRTDNTFWAVKYVNQNEGDYHTWRDGDTEMYRVYPKTETTVVTTWHRKPQE